MVTSTVYPRMKKISFLKTVLFSLIPLTAVFVVAEVGLRTTLYQYRSRYVLALQEVYEKAHQLVITKLVERRLGNLNIPGGTREALYTDDGSLLLHEFQGRYEANFSQLVQETEKIGSKLMMVYIPSDDFHSKLHQMDVNRAFFAELCAKYHIPFLDVTEKFLKYPSDVVTLLPADNHLSRFGNQIVADEIGQTILSLFRGYKSGVHFDVRPALLGDFRPNDDSIWTQNPSLPYHVRINSQGLRMDSDLNFPKTKQRILILGDSVTFGVFLHGHDTYPGLLNRKYPDNEFVNAGVQGYTVFQELSLFKERAKYAEPDVTVLQVLDNDLYDFYYFRLNEFDRERKSHEPSALEQSLLQKLRRGN